MLLECPPNFQAHTFMYTTDPLKSISVHSYISMHVYTHAHIHTCARQKHVFTLRYAYVHRCKNTCSYTHIHRKKMHAQARMHTHSQRITHSHTDMPRCTQYTEAHKDTTDRHTCTHTLITNTPTPTQQHTATHAHTVHTCTPKYTHT